MEDEKTSAFLVTQTQVSITGTTMYKMIASNNEFLLAYVVQRLLKYDGL